MSFAFKKYKRIFRRNLQPIFAVLVVRRREVEMSAWKKLVDETLQHVIDNPIEYLGNDLPDNQLMLDILNEIRNDFLKESYTLLAVPRH
jgi:hypothetical protein